MLWALNNNSSPNVWKNTAWGIGQPLFYITGHDSRMTFTNSSVAINNANHGWHSDAGSILSISGDHTAWLFERYRNDSSAKLRHPTHQRRLAISPHSKK
jgi:hypothetical protein